MYNQCVRSLLSKLQKAGLTLVSVFDGCEYHGFHGASSTTARADASEVICSVDESWLKVSDSSTSEEGTLFIVLGNDKSEIVCDYAGPAKLMHKLDLVCEKFADQWE